MKHITLITLLFATLITFGQESFNQLIATNKFEEASRNVKLEHLNDPQNEEHLVNLLTINSILNAEPEEILKDLIKLKAISKNVEMYYYKFWQSAFVIKNGGYNKFVLKELNWIINESNFDGTLKMIAKEYLSDHYFYTNNHEERYNVLETIGSINNWSIVGSFENISASGFDNDYAPITKFLETDKFKDRKGAEIHWFDINKRKKGTDIWLHQHLNTANSVSFAQSFITSPIDQEVEIRFSNTGAFKIWVNDGLSASMKEETSTYGDVYISKIKLNKGTNRILVQMGTAEYNKQFFKLRITDSKGMEIKDLTSSPFADSYTKNASTKENLTYYRYCKYFQDKFDANNTSIINYKFLIDVLNATDQKRKLRNLLETGYKTFSSSSIINLAMLNHYSDIGSWALYSEKLEEIKKKDPKGLLSSSEFYKNALKMEKYEEARDYLAHIQTLTGETPYVLTNQIDLELKLKNQTKAVELINNAYTRYPNNYNIVSLKYAVETSVNQNSKAGLKLLKKYLKKNFSQEAFKQLGNHYFNNNAYSAGLSVYQQIETIFPDYYSPKQDLASIYFSSQQYNKAIVKYDELISSAPFVGSFQDSQGDCYAELDLNDEAIEYYQTALKYTPSLFETRKKIRKIEGKSSIEEQFEAPELDELVKQEINKVDYPEDNSVILHEERQIILYEGGGQEEFSYNAVAVLNNAGVDTWKEYYIPVGSSQDLMVEKAEIIKSNGNISKAETNYNHIVFSGLEEGDKIIFSYKIKSYYSGILSEHFWDKQFMEYFIPMNKGIYSIIYHDSYDLNYHMENSSLEPIKSEFDNYKKLIWQVDSVPSVKSENYMPELVDAGATLHLSTIPSWEYVIDWYDGLSSSKAKAGFEVKQVVKEIFPTDETFSDLEKAKKIYEFIVNNIRYSSVSFRQSGWIPQKASSVLNTKIGDCKDVSTLFVILCKEVGISANLVLVNTKDNGRKKMVLPTIEFNHCIANVSLDSSNYFIELTSDLLPFSTISGNLKNAFVLNIDPENKEKPFYLDKKSMTRNGTLRKSKITLEGGKAKVSTTNFKTGRKAADMRGSYRDLGEEARFKQMSSSLSFDFSTIKLDKFNFDETINGNSDTVNYNYDFTVNTPYTKIGNLEILRVPLISKVYPFDFLTVDERHFDIELWNYIDYDFSNEDIVISIPNDKKVMELPENISLKNKFGSYELTFVQKSNELHISRVFNLNADLIKKEDYSEFRKFIDKLVEVDNINIGLRKK